jgi:hypothetical protein
MLWKAHGLAIMQRTRNGEGNLMAALTLGLAYVKPFFGV